MRALDSNGMLWVWPQVQAANASSVSTEKTSRSRYKTSISEESCMKLTKNASILHSPEVFSPLGQLRAQDGKSHCSPKTYYTGYIMHSTLSSPPYDKRYTHQIENRCFSYSIVTATLCIICMTLLKFATCYTKLHALIKN